MESTQQQLATSKPPVTVSGRGELPIVDPEFKSERGGLLARLLVEQNQLTAVEEFSRNHDDGEAPAQARYYSKLLPTTPPAEGQQYAFEVDLDRCSGCKACVTACHSLNGLDDRETWRDVGLLIGGDQFNPMMQHVTTACHHCLEPGCMIGCPVEAYEKDPVTGIVKHLDDQCFGCQYCTLACPYEVPKYHAGKGIVRKCDMCSDRLAVGEAPACVQACPHEAISIQLVDVDEVAKITDGGPFLPGAPDSRLTRPTTRFRSKRNLLQNTLPADVDALTPQHPHWPLIVMLVLTQLSVGTFVVGMAISFLLKSPEGADLNRWVSLFALGFGHLALAASTVHLGRPQYAFRGMIGWRHSWLSREIILFGMFAGAATAYTASLWLDGPAWLVMTLALGTAITGVVGVFCSVMIYVFTGRDFWSLRTTVPKFFLTTALLGVSSAFLVINTLAIAYPSTVSDTLVFQSATGLAIAILTFATLKLVLEATLFRYLFNDSQFPLRRSAKLQAGPLHHITMLRFLCGISGGVLLPTAMMLTRSVPGSLGLSVGAATIFVSLLLGELLERYLFFTSCAPAKMPGRLNP